MTRAQTPMKARRLLTAIHDVGPRFEGEVDRLLALIERHVPSGRLAMLVVPDHWGESPIVPGSAFAGRLRHWGDMGVEMFVHGYYHRDTSSHARGIARFKARHMTAGEGEFLGLDYADALARMRAGRMLVEDVTGRAATGFVAPAWLYGDSAHEALGECGFALAEDHMKIWNPPTGHVIARGPVITWASRSRARIASSLFAARLLPPLLRSLPVVRVAVHPGDVHVPSLVRSIDRTVATLSGTHSPGRYADLLSHRDIVRYAF